MRRQDSDLLALVRSQRTARPSYSYSQCNSRSRSGSLESDVRRSERAFSVASDLDGADFLDVDDLQLVEQQTGDNNHESVRVTVRFRSLLPKEKTSPSAWAVNSETGTIEAASGVGQTSRRRQVYAFDEVYDASHSTRTIYDGIARSIARSALDGIHGSIFAYGQTSSGKTFTMQGSGLRQRRMTMLQEQREETEEDRRPEDGDGLVQLAVKDLFDEMARRTDVEYIVRVSYLEVYNETIKDLLASNLTSAGKRKDSVVQIRQHPVTGVFTDSLERVVTDARGVLQALSDGEKRRSVGVTGMNERSSRSHSIFQVRIESKTRLETPVSSDDKTDLERVRLGCLNFVDLAGSESARAVCFGGKKLTTESSNINRSLLALSRVVVALGSSKSPNQQDHINFRDSKLTRILQPSLSGSARVLFVCCASPASTYVEETLSTLKFARRAKRIKVSASVNEVMDPRARVLMELARENHLLRQQLEALESTSRDERDAMKMDAARLNRRIVSLEAAAAAPSWTCSKVVTIGPDTTPKRQNVRHEGGNQVLELTLSDEEDTDIDSQFDSPTDSPLTVVNASNGIVDFTSESTETRELDSMHPEQVKDPDAVKLPRQNQENSSSSSTFVEIEDDADLVAETNCVLKVAEENETTTLSCMMEGTTTSTISSLSLKSAALLAIVASGLKERSPSEALAIVTTACVCMVVMLASLAGNIAALTL